MFYEITGHFCLPIVSQLKGSVLNIEVLSNYSKRIVSEGVMLIPSEQIEQIIDVRVAGKLISLIKDKDGGKVLGGILRYTDPESKKSK